ncbi:MAG: FtsX-like permease family protein [Deltaproteobacteria bacterium]|nr:FtsX-like permease family protein [Deltaproteobacteria bacterium]
MKAIDRKLFREVLRLRGQALTIAIVVASGVACYISLQSAWRALYESRDLYYESNRFADVFVHLKRAPKAVAGQIAELSGVARAYPRIVEHVRLPMDDLVSPARGDLISIPDTGEAPLNGVVLRSGRQLEPGRYDEVLVNEPFAQIHGLEPGDHLSAVINGKLRELRIVGHALSPEYVFAVDTGLLMPDDARFTPIWMLEDAIAAAYQMEGAFNDLAVKLEPGASEERVLSAIDRVLEPYGGLGAFTREHQISNSILTSEIQGIETLVVFLPGVFLGVAAFLLNVVFSRLVSLQRPQIAVLKAMGYRNSAVATHYFKMVAVIVGVGALIGLGLGVWLGKGMLAMYAEFFRLPQMPQRVDLSVSVNAILFSLLAGALGASLAVRAAVSLPPAEAMRPPAPASYNVASIERWGWTRWVSQPALMVIREIWRRPGRTALSSLGIALALSIVILGRFGYDAYGPMVMVQFEKQQREDLTVSFSEAMPQRGLGYLGHVPGVQEVEGLRTTPVRIRSGHRWRDTVLVGIPEGSRLRRLFDLDFERVPIPERGVLLTSVLGDILGVEPGDIIDVTLKEGDRGNRELVVAGLIEEGFGLQGYLAKSNLHSLLREGPRFSSALLRIDKSREGIVQSRLNDIPAIQAVSRKSDALASFEKQTDQTMKVMTLIMTLFAIAIAISIVYNNARVSVSMRARDLATLRVLGFTRGEISAILLGEQAVQIAIAIPLGLLLGTLGAKALIASWADPEIFRIPFVISNQTYAFAVAVVLFSGIASALLVRRKLDKLDLIGVLKTRE